MVSLFTCCPLNRKCHVKEKSRWKKILGTAMQTNIYFVITNLTTENVKKY